MLHRGFFGLFNYNMASTLLTGYKLSSEHYLIFSIIYLLAMIRFTFYTAAQ